MTDAASPSDPSPKLAGRRVLVVEDEYFVALDIRRALAGAGVTVVGPVGTLEKGLKLAEEPLDAAVLDVNLAETMSYPVAERLRTRGVPYLFLTGYDDWSMKEDHPAAPHLIKPFAPEVLVDAVVRLLAAAGAARQDGD